MTKKSSEANDVKLLKIVSMARLGWWEADFGENVYHCSDFVSDLLGLECDTISFEDFGKLICEEYRERIRTEFISFKEVDVYEQIFPIHSKYGVIWVNSKVGEKSVAEDGSVRVLGMLQCISRQMMNTQKEVINRQNSLFYRQNSISRSLLDFLQEEDDVSEVVNKILRDVLNQFNGDRTYIFKYNKEENVQDCTYEITAEGISNEKHNLQELSMSATNWWSERLLGGSPIILTTLNELPEEADYDRSVLEAQDIKSVMALPMISKDGVWGYIGIDIVKEHREWSNEDYHWFASISNIISICLELRKSEEEARMEKKYLDNLYRHMPLGYVRLKLIYEDGIPTDYNIVDANEACGKISGEPYDKYIGMTGGSMKETNLKVQLPYLLEVINSGRHREITFHLEEAGKICHSIMYSPQHDEVVVMFSDMTETFVAHEALDRSEKILRNIYQNLPVGIELYDKDGYLIDLNDKELEIFGLKSKEDALGVNFFDNPVVPAELKEALKKGNPVDFSFIYNFDHLDSYYSSSHAGVIYLITKITPLFDSSGKLINYLFINIDNTETTNAYSKIQEFEEFFTLVGDYAKVGYAHFNAISRDGYALSSWYKNVGEEDNTPLSQIIGIHSHFHPDDRELMLSFFDKVLKGESTSLRSDMRICRPDGYYTWTSVNLMVKDYRPEDGIVEMVCINYDITELKETEKKLIEAKNKAETLDRLKSAFLANMSHEIRTPLNAIVGFSNLLVETEDIEERKQYISIVQENNELLLQLISDILDLSKIEAGTFDFVKGNVDVNLLCSEIACSHRLKAPARVEILFEDCLPECYVWSDKNRLTQVISNFINNALKFTSSGSISLGYHLCDNQELEFYVRDTGMGIPADKIDSVFDRFVKLNYFIHGTGLGLSICKSIVEQMGGHIGVKSKEGEGSYFWFTHPYVQVNVERSIKKCNEVERDVLSPDIKPRVLIAEDTDSNYLLISSLLKNKYELKRAYTGKEAVEFHQLFKPDIVLMDIKMPEMDGFEATAIIRKNDN